MATTNYYFIQHKQMSFNKLTPSLITEIAAAVGASNVFTDAETRDKHSRDYTENFQFMPDVVVAPQNTEGYQKCV